MVWQVTDMKEWIMWSMGRVAINLVPTLAVQSEYFMVGQGGTVEAAGEKGWKHL
jgi:hypothetical protein